MSVGTLQTFTYDDLMAWANINAQSVNYNMQEWFDIAASYGVGEEEALIQYLDSFTGSAGGGLKVSKAADGTYTGYFYDSVQQYTSTSPINSNISTVSRGNLKQMVGQKFTDVGGTLTRNMTTRPAGGGLGANAKYFLGSAASAFCAVSTGIALGKTIDSALYNVNPDYWDSIGLSSLNPETWSTITQGNDSPFAGMFNFILGIDPDTGKSQAYMNQNAFAYMAYALAQNGWFSADAGAGEYTVDDTSLVPNVAMPVYAGPVNALSFSSSSGRYLYTHECATECYAYVVPSGSGYNIGFASPSEATIKEFRTDTQTGKTSLDITYRTSRFTYNNKTLYSFTFGGQYINISIPSSSYINSFNQVQFGYVVLYGTAHIAPTIDGVSDQDGATLPDTSTWDTIPNTLTSLQNQYPNIFGSPMTWDMYDDDGTPNQTTWVPIPIPDFISDTGTTPTSGEQTQSSLDVDLLNKTLQDLLAKILQLTEPTPQPEPSPEPQPQPQPTPNPPIPSNPDPTGDGETPPIPTITGEASALWSVYNPTQAQVNSFGAWLWSSPFVTNILKLFQNPIEGVISLHKIFATPVTGASANIVVGTLDSNVSSVTVTDQYTYVDCGSIDLYEQFGNVFDYSPFTEVSLYLPFIGIVTLDVADIMRSSIHISYGVDVYTGTCLAMVEVTRDACTVNMYQYSGVCSVEYPLSNVQNSQMLSGILSVAAGVATVATAGAAGAGVSALMGTAGGLAAMGKQHVGRSGGFSGNAGAMGIKKPYLIIQRPQIKVADTFPSLVGYPTNVSGTLSDFSGQVRVTDVHVEGIPATDSELTQIEELLKSGILI